LPILLISPLRITEWHTVPLNAVRNGMPVTDDSGVPSFRF
jgi:hypothetical protein